MRTISTWDGTGAVRQINYTIDSHITEYYNYRDFNTVSRSVFATEEYRDTKFATRFESSLAPHTRLVRKPRNESEHRFVNVDRSIHNSIAQVRTPVLRASPCSGIRSFRVSEHRSNVNGTAAAICACNGALAGICLTMPYSSASLTAASTRSRFT